MGESYQLRSVSVEIESRRDYLHIVLRGDPASPDDVDQLTSLLRREMGKQATQRLLVDARDLARELPHDACDAAWAFVSARSCRQLAWIAPLGTPDMTITRLNMAGVAESLAFRAFTTIIDAHRWLGLRTTGERRLSTGGMAAVRDSGTRPVSSPPPADPRAEPAADARAETSALEDDLRSGPASFRKRS